jgi:recombination protein RecA
VPRAEIEGEMGDAHVGLQARLMSQALRKLAGVISRSNTALIFTNQLRMKIGVMYGNPETTTGGNALKFYASVRMDIRKTDVIKNGNDQVGTRVKVSVKKNKVAPPFRVAEFDVLFNEGISREGDILDVAAEMGIVEKRGAYYSYRDTRLGQGREQVKEYLRKHPDTRLEIENQARVKAGLPAKPAMEPAK